MNRKKEDKFKCKRCGEKFHYLNSLLQHEQTCGKLNKITRRE